MCVFVFFVRQKTAYEMRISDWSSDVCSSDLPDQAARVAPRRSGLGAKTGRVGGEALGQLLFIEDALAHQIGQRNFRRRDRPEPEIGRASCRERVCQYV